MRTNYSVRRKKRKKKDQRTSCCIPQQEIKRQHEKEEVRGTEKKEKGRTSLNPSRKALVWSSMPRFMRHSVMRRMYSSLFSSLTRTLSPPGFSSWCVSWPSTSKSAEKYSSRPHSCHRNRNIHRQPQSQNQPFRVARPYFPLLFLFKFQCVAFLRFSYRNGSL